MLGCSTTKPVANLFSRASEISGKKFSYEQLTGLPDPVQRYFKLVLKEGSPYVSYVRLKHNGQFKTAPNKEWIDIEGEQYFTSAVPGFVWIGKTSTFKARDQYIAGKGELSVYLFSFIRIAQEKGDKVTQGELLRWLGESVWFPTNLLPRENLKWTPIDSNSAKLTFDYNDLSVWYKVYFNNKGEITLMETKRYKGADDLETWVGKLSDYKRYNGTLIPSKIEGVWMLDSGEYSYARFNVQKIEYDVPRAYE